MTTSEIVKSQHEFFATNKTKSVKWRIEKLKALRASIKRHEEDILNALKADLNKAHFEGYAAEVGMVLDELRHCISQTKKWAKPKRVHTSIVNFLSFSKIYSEPYGVVLVMAPWNYPFLLSMDPVIGAICAGNCFVLKPSAYSKHTSDILKTIIEEVFEPNCGVVILGGREENQALLNEKFDYIFFTGSTEVGKQVMAAASRNLTPVSLELGGKSPCIVDETANIPLAAKRIVWGKFLNAGQTCVAPDYLYVHKSVKDKLMHEIDGYVKKSYGENPLSCEEYPKLINQKHFERVCEFIKGEKIIFGGQSNSETNKIAPTLLDNITWDCPVMKEEIFGPVLPVLTFTGYDEIIPVIKAKDKPLALYLFTTSNRYKKRVLNEISYGGGCINDTIVHLSSSHMPFGGVGASGMGGYHGKFSFDTFSHKKSVLTKSNLLDFFIRYAPYKDHLKLLKKLLK